MKVWITKYALTKGIFSLDVRMTSQPGMVCFQAKYCVTHYHRGEWHKTEEEACCKAKEMQQRKITSLQKQLDKIRLLNF